MTSTPVDLMTLVEQFGDDNKCREALTKLRWPKGVKCLRCGHDKVTPVNERKVYDCNSCHYQFSVTVGTMFHDSHLSLSKWFFVTYLMTESKKGISASQVYRMLRKEVLQDRVVSLPPYPGCDGCCKIAPSWAEQ